MVTKLAIMGGTFDPIHIGHLRTAQSVYKQLGFDHIVFIPAFLPPHKQQRHDFASAKDRLAMVRLALQDYPYFSIDELELNKGGLSYTYDTVIRLQKQHPDSRLYLLIGADSLVQLPTWHKSKELFELVHFVAADRPGYGAELEKLKSFFGPRVTEKIILVDTPEVDVSSTEIRARIGKGLPIRGLVPKAVEDYIVKHRLYLD